MSSKFVFFDVGGVLLDFAQADSLFCARFGLDINRYNEQLKIYMTKALIGEIDEMEMWEGLVKGSGGKYDESINYNHIWIDNCKPLIKGHELLEEMKKQYRIGLLTNIWAGFFPKIIDSGQIPDAGYEFIIQSWEERCRKPDDKIYMIAKTLSDVEHSEIILIDDTRENIDKANELGWKGIYFTSDKKNISEEFISGMI